MANIINGSDLMLFENNKALGYATSHTLTLSTETADTSHKDIKGSWKSSMIKSRSWEISVEALFSDDKNKTGFDKLFDKYVANTSSAQKVHLVFSVCPNPDNLSESPEGGWEDDGTVPHSNGYYFEGDAIVTALSLNAPNGDNASYSATFTGVGELKKYNN